MLNYKKSLAFGTAILVGFSLAGITNSAVQALPTDTVLINDGMQEIDAQYGKISWSIDGSSEAGHLAGDQTQIQVDKPAGATVRVAYLISGDGGNRNSTDPMVNPQDVYLNGEQVTFTHHSYINTSPGGNSWNNFNTYYGDVTSLVAATIDAAPTGTLDIAFDQGDGNDGNSVEGGNLIVIFDDPSAPLSSIHLNAGTTDPAGSTTTLTFPALTTTNLSNPIQLSLGISNSWQMNPANWDGEWNVHQQSSTIEVNGDVISNAAGGCDDSRTAALAEGCNFGGYNTIGGVGDSDNIPPLTQSNPLDLHEDDELYNVVSHMTLGDTSLTIRAVNPSSDDNLFFSGIYLKGILPTADYCDVHHADCFPNETDSSGAASPTKHTKQAVIYFDKLSAKLDKKDKAKLKKFAKSLPASARISIKVLGYVQPTKKSSNDKSLSKRRAFMVKTQLKKYGLDGVFSTSGRGKSKFKGWKGRRVVVTATYTTMPST